jgi:hypothetical protein
MHSTAAFACASCLQELETLECGHTYHAECVCSALDHNRGRSRREICPLRCHVAPVDADATEPWDDHTEEAERAEANFVM